MSQEGRMKIKIVHGFVNHAPGDEVTVATVADGVPKDLYWRRRLRDAAIDGCVEVVTEGKKNRKSVDVPVTDGGSE